MSSPPIQNFDCVDDHNKLASRLYASDDLLSLLEDNNIFLAIEDCDANRCLDLNIYHEQANYTSLTKGNSNEGLMENIENHKTSLVPLEASDNLCMILQERSTLQINGQINTRSELNSCALEQEKSTLAEPILEQGLQGNSIKYHDHNGLSTTLMVSENLWPNLEENYDNSERLDPRTKGENSVLEPSVHKGLQENGVNYLSGIHNSCLSNPLETSDNPWPHMEEGTTSQTLEKHISEGLDSSRMLLEHKTSALATSNMKKRLLGKRILNARTRERNRSFKPLQTVENFVLLNAEKGSTSKKQEHNAKEKVRRMKLNATFLALGALLPADSRRKKKKRSAPVMIDRAVEYIPELQNEIQKLTLKKNNLLSTIEKKKNLGQTPQLDHQAPTVSLHEVAKGEVIIQICILKDQETVFSKVLENVEAADMCIMSASTLQACNKRVCCHLHVKITGSSLQADYVAISRENIISWLRG